MNSEPQASSDPISVSHLPPRYPVLSLLCLNCIKVNLKTEHRDHSIHLCTPQAFVPQRDDGECMGDPVGERLKPRNTPWAQSGLPQGHLHIMVPTPFHFSRGYQDLRVDETQSPDLSHQSDTHSGQHMPASKMLPLCSKPRCRQMCPIPVHHPLCLQGRKEGDRSHSHR